MISEQFISLLKTRSLDINSERKELLDKLVDIIHSSLKETNQAVVKFICTHNSRRSQAAEFLLDVLARENKLNILALSAGTEYTAFNINMVEALREFGFELIEFGDKKNPLYIYSIGVDDLYYYSKTYDDKLNQVESPIIVTVCGDANENCPVIPGTYERIHVGYKDPKSSDGTAHQEETYKNKVLEIGSEMYYLIDRLKRLVTV